MSQEIGINLEIAFKKIHELVLADGDLGYTYWHQIGQLLKHAATKKIDALSKELERCRARRCN